MNIRTPLAIVSIIAVSITTGTTISNIPKNIRKADTVYIRERIVIKGSQLKIVDDCGDSSTNKKMETVAAPQVNSERASFLPAVNDSFPKIHSYNELGDYYAGFYGSIIGAISTLLSIIGLVYVGISFRNSKNAEVNSQETSIALKMIDNQDSIVSNFSYGSCEGRECFSLILREITAIFQLAKSHNCKLPEDKQIRTVDLINIAYTYTYYGPTISGSKSLAEYDFAFVKAINDDIAMLKQKPKFEGMFLGHQNRLSNYMRNMYNTFEFIESSTMDSKLKESLSKLFRLKMTNYEQGILAVNILSKMGTEWRSTGLLAKCQAIKNIPKAFFETNLRIDIKETFPEIIFEFEKYQIK